MNMDPDEIRKGIAALGDADILRLKKASGYWSANLTLNGDDLLHEAVCRALDGVRNCPKDVPLVNFLLNVMRSMSDAERKRAANRQLHHSVETGGHNGEAIEIADETPSAESFMLNKEDNDARVRALEALFEDDDECALMMMARLDGMPRGDIQDELTIDARQYDTIWKRTRRKIDSAYPNGWQND